MLSEIRASMRPRIHSHIHSQQRQSIKRSIDCLVLYSILSLFLLDYWFHMTNDTRGKRPLRLQLRPESMPMIPLHRFTSFPLQFPLSFLFFFLFKFFFLHCYHTPQSRSPFRGTADKSNKRIGDLCCSKLIHLVGDIEVFASNNMRIFNCLVDFATDRKPSFLNKCVIFGPLFILYNPCA